MILNIYKNSNKNSSKIFTEIQDRAFVISWNILEKNLDKIIKSDFDINQIILNSKEFPYLDNILNATFENKNNSDFYVFYYVSFEIKDKNNNAYNEIIKSIKNFDILLSEKFKKLNKRKNIFFIEKNNTIDTTLREYFKRYETGNFNKFRKIINNLYYSGHDNINKESLIAFRIDFLKIMGVLYVFNIGYKSAIIIDPDIFPRFDDILIEDFYENKKIFFRFCNFYRHNKEIKRKYDIHHQDIDLSEMIKKKKLIKISTCISESLIGLKNEDFIKKILLRFIDPINNYIGIGWQIYCLRNKAILSEETKEISDIVKYLKKKNIRI